MSDQLFARLGRTFEAGSILFREDEPGNTMFVIQTGQVRITKATRDGEKTLAVLGPGEFFGEMAILNSKPRNATAEAQTELRVLVIDAKTLSHMVVGNAEIAVRMITKLARRLDAANALIEVLMHRDPKARVILGLCRQAEMHGQTQEDGSVLIAMSAEDFAADVGLTREETDEVLVRIRRLKIVSDAGDRGFIVRDLKRLEEFLEFLEARERVGEI
jgi:CRP-like cAMP-binding protein